MNSLSRAGYVFKILAALAVCASTYWLSHVLDPWFSFFYMSEFDVGYILFSIFMPFFLGLPVFFGLYFGIKGICRTDAATVKGLVASCCFALEDVLAIYVYTLSTEMRPISFLSKEVTNELVILFLTIAAVGVYLLVSRRFLRSLNLPCPSIRQSLPAWPIGIIAYLFWSTGMKILEYNYPVGSKNEEASILYFAGVTLLAIAVYKYGVGLFVRQEMTVKPKVPTDSCARDCSIQ